MLTCYCSMRGVGTHARVVVVKSWSVEQAPLSWVGSASGSDSVHFFFFFLVLARDVNNDNDQKKKLTR
jgi:hypothetical protein